MKTINAQDLLDAYNGKYKYVIENRDGSVVLWNIKPYPSGIAERWVVESGTVDNFLALGNIAITEFQDRDWDSCIYKAKPSEEDWVGKTCWFADVVENLEWPNRRRIGILKKIHVDKTCTTYEPDYYQKVFFCCRPVRPDEIKFFNDDTSEE